MERALYLLHPAAVHFPIVLLALGAAAAGGRLFPRAPGWLDEAAAPLLWMGTASAWITLGLGLLAESNAPHVPAAWEVLAEHEELAWWTCGVFTVLSCLGACAAKIGGMNVLMRRATALLWALGLGLLFATAMRGGRL
ncbi:MAG: DUF2231 domain-containing protein, partial [Elusimicrobiota bacterium]